MGCSLAFLSLLGLLPLYQAFLPSQLAPLKVTRSCVKQQAAVRPTPQRSRLIILQAASDDPSSEQSKSENDAIWGLTDLGNANFGKFGSEIDPHRHVRPQWMDVQAEWKKHESVDFLPELKEVQERIQGVNIYLVGMPGSGKTTMGTMLAEGLNYRWMDLDQFIEQKLGKTATQVFAEEGEATWRKQENLGLGALQTFVQTVVSTGGGVMQQKENFPFLHSGLIVWLDLPPEQIVERMKKSGEIEKRPLLKEATDPIAALRKLYEDRKKNYALADVRVVLGEKDDAIRALKKLTHRIIEELDLRPPKAKAWEDKREKMKSLWDQMKSKGANTNINTPAPEDGENPAIGAIASLKSADVTKSKGFGKDIRKSGGGKEKEGWEGEGGAKDEKGGSGLPAAAEVGSQGVGFALGLEEYMKGSTGSSSSDEGIEVPVEGA